MVPMSRILRVRKTCSKNDAVSQVRLSFSVLVLTNQQHRLLERLSATIEQQESILSRLFGRQDWESLVPLSREELLSLALAKPESSSSTPSTVATNAHSQHESLSLEAMEEMQGASAWDVNTGLLQLEQNFSRTHLNFSPIETASSHRSRSPSSLNMQAEGHEAFDAMAFVPYVNTPPDPVALRIATLRHELGNPHILPSHAKNIETVLKGYDNRMLTGEHVVFVQDGVMYDSCPPPRPGTAILVEVS
jgi:hypothetical protein